jgi:hypothetical protein
VLANLRQGRKGSRGLLERLACAKRALHDSLPGVIYLPTIDSNGTYNFDLTGESYAKPAAVAGDVIRNEFLSHNVPWRCI